MKTFAQNKIFSIAEFIQIGLRNKSFNEFVRNCGPNYGNVSYVWYNKVLPAEKWLVENSNGIFKKDKFFYQTKHTDIIEWAKKYYESYSKHEKKTITIIDLNTVPPTITTITKKEIPSLIRIKNLIKIGLGNSDYVSDDIKQEANSIMNWLCSQKRPHIKKVDGKFKPSKGTYYSIDRAAKEYLNMLKSKPNTIITTSQPKVITRNVFHENQVNAINPNALNKLLGKKIKERDELLELSIKVNDDFSHDLYVLEGSINTLQEILSIPVTVFYN